MPGKLGVLCLAAFDPFEVGEAHVYPHVVCENRYRYMTNVLLLDDIVSCL